MVSETVFSLIFSGLQSTFGFSIFIPIIIIGVFVLLAFNKNLPIVSLFVLMFMGIWLIGSYEIDNIPLIPLEFRALFVILFGLILGIMFFLLFYRR